MHKVLAELVDSVTVRLIGAKILAHLAISLDHTSVKVNLSILST